MRLQAVDPNRHPDWDGLLLRGGDSCFFHSSAWARVLSSTYGFKPLYFAAIEAGRLAFLMPFMEIDSPLTGRRGVSLPFTDRCPPYATGGGDDLREAVTRVMDYGRRAKWRYAEWRDESFFPEGRPAWTSFHFHEIDLRRGEAELFSALGDCCRRNIRKAGGSGVTVRFERSAEAMSEFYRLNVLTRKRHGLPPQPLSFFRNVFEQIILKDMGIVAVAVHGRRAVAASVYFFFSERGLYKYGASDLKHQGLRPNNILMWEALLWLKDKGFLTMDLGRTETGNIGLLRFKRAWGAKETMIRYYRYDFRGKTYVEREKPPNILLTRLFRRTPRPALRLIGRLFYRHVG